jgi:hypothetical protein
MSSSTAPDISKNGVCIMLSGIIASFVIGYLLAWYSYGYPSKVDTAHSRFVANQPLKAPEPPKPEVKPGSERFHSGVQSQEGFDAKPSAEFKDFEDHDMQVVERMRSYPKGG